MPEKHPSIGGLRLVLGGNVFNWTIDRDKSFKVLDAFYEAGGRMIDTAEAYSVWVPGNTGGDSERVIGEWLESRGVRTDMLIATKTGLGKGDGKLKPERVAKALEVSLENLRSDYVDLYYAHRDDETTPLDEAIDAYDALYRAGKVREIGASNYGAERLAAIIALAKEKGAQPFTVLQPLYNLVDRSSYEGPLMDLCEANDIAVTPYYALAAGFLSGKYSSEKDWEGHARAHALKEASENGGWKILETVRAVAAELNVKPAHVAIAWLNARPTIAAPIASATTPDQLADLVAAVTLELSPDQVDRLTTAA